MHKTIWFKIHWFFGFVFGILLLLIGVSGAVLSYEKEILQAINKDTYFVNIPQDKQILSTKEILEKYQTENPDSKINSISFSSDKSSSVVLNIASKDPNNKRGESIYLNPYTAEVLPQIEEKVRRIVNNNEPITDGAPIIFTEKKDGVLPEYNIRTLS